MNKEKKTPIVVSSHDIQLDSTYVKWICDVKQRFRSMQIKAAVKVNSEQLLFNWQMGRDLVVRKAEDTWGTGIVEQVSLDLQNEFPLTRGFSARNLWSMKKWYSFYSGSSESEYLLQNLTEQLDLGSIKLNQIGAEIEEPTNDEKLHQLGAEMRFPTVFGFVPWRHHVEIVNKCKTVEEALFYIRKIIENGLSRSALIDILKADLYHTVGTAVTNFSEKLPTIQGKLAQQIIKDTYVLHGSDEKTGDIAVVSEAYVVDSSAITVYKTQDFDPNNPIYKVKTWDKDGNVTERMVDVSKIDPKNCDTVEMYAYAANLIESGKGSFEDIMRIVGSAKDRGRENCESWSYSTKMNWVDILKDITQELYDVKDFKSYMEWKAFLELLEK